MSDFQAEMHQIQFWVGNEVERGGLGMGWGGEKEEGEGKGRKGRGREGTPPGSCLKFSC